VTSLGLIGTNAHVILEEFLHSETPCEKYPNIVFLSARTEESLQAMAVNLRNYLSQHPNLSIDDLAFTLNVGRRSFNHKFVTVAESTEELINILTNFINDRLTGVKQYWVYRQSKKQKTIRELDDLYAMLNQKNDTFNLAILEMLQQGKEIDLEDIYRDQNRKRLSLPGYVFDRKSYYLKVETNLYDQIDRNKIKDIDQSVYINVQELLHQLVWGKEEIIETKSCQPGIWILFHDQLGIGQKLHLKLKTAGHTVIQVSIGNEFKKKDELNYSIRLDYEDDYEELIKEIVNHFETISGIIHLFNCQLDQLDILHPAKKMDMRLRRTVYSVLYLNKALMKYYQNLTLYYVTTNAQKISDDDLLVIPEKRMIWAMNKVMNQENYGYRLFNIDFNLTTASVEQINQQIFDEITFNQGDVLEIVYRRNQRFVQFLSPVKVDENNANDFDIKDNGVYLVTGGLGGIALELCKYMASRAKINLILLNRTPLTDKKDRHLIEQILQRLKKLTVELMVFCILLVLQEIYRHLKQQIVNS
ncbi:MAG: KR domain-containing protein, partial [Halanaerobiales bacterium]|nr:KR domain-containing protein [Halanaerobiales bacterium]